MAAILVIATIVAAVALDVLLVTLRRRRGVVPVVPAVGMREPGVPPGLFLDSAHAWARITSTGSLRIGVDALLAEALGEAEGIEVPRKGEKVSRRDSLFTLRVRGRKVEVPAPVDGEVMAVNPLIVEQPWTVARDPYGVGWVVEMWVRDHQEAIRPLRVGAAATAFAREEFRRLVDFLTGTGAAGPVPVLADGGVPVRGAAARLGDEAFEAFKNEFVGPETR